jgi:hypothetical protein
MEQTDRDERWRDRDESGRDRDERGRDRDERGRDRDERDRDRDERGRDRDERGRDRDERGRDRDERDRDREERGRDRDERDRDRDERGRDRDGDSVIKEMETNGAGERYEGGNSDALLEFRTMQRRTEKIFGRFSRDWSEIGGKEGSDDECGCVLNLIIHWIWRFRV